jgi:TRAP-type C4-dicarboxylate transport system permease small subunit
MIRRIMTVLPHIFDSVTRIIGWVTHLVLGSMILITCADIAGRYIFNKPISGSYEITEICMGVFGGFALFYTTTKLGHIVVDVLVVKFSPRLQIILFRIGALLGFIVWTTISYRVLLLSQSGDLTVLLNVPLAPFQIALALGLFLAGLTLFTQIFHPAASVKKEEEPNR